MEFNWLPLSFRKGLSTPSVIVNDSMPYGGCYWWRTADRYITPFDVDLKEGPVIEVPSNCRPSTLAHEFRHHWQREILGCDRVSTWSPKSDSPPDYWQEIRRYFSVYWHERDALMFEVATSQDEINLEWLDSIHVPVSAAVVMQ